MCVHYTYQCMELDTEKLLPALQRHFEHGDDQDEAAAHADKHYAGHVGEEHKIARGVQAATWWSSKDKPESRSHTPPLILHANV